MSLTCTCFTQSETYTLPSEETAEKYHARYSYDYHGRAGPIKKTFPLWFNSLHGHWQETLVGLGAPMNSDGVTRTYYLIDQYVDSPA